MPLLPPFCSWSLVVRARWQTLSAELMLEETDTCISQGCAVFRDCLIARFGTSGFRAPGRGRGGCRIYGHTCSNTWHSCLLRLVKRLWTEGEMTRHSRRCSCWNPDKRAVLTVAKLKLYSGCFYLRDFWFVFSFSLHNLPRLLTVCHLTVKFRTFPWGQAHHCCPPAQRGAEEAQPGEGSPWYL